MIVIVYFTGSAIGVFVRLASAWEVAAMTDNEETATYVGYAPGRNRAEASPRRSPGRSVLIEASEATRK
jgi:hypothetical protein